MSVLWLFYVSYLLWWRKVHPGPQLGARSFMNVYIFFLSCMLYILFSFIYGSISFTHTTFVIITRLCIIYNIRCISHYFVVWCEYFPASCYNPLHFMFILLFLWFKSINQKECNKDEVTSATGVEITFLLLTP